MVHILFPTCSPWAPYLDLIVPNLSPASLVVLQKTYSSAEKSIGHTWLQAAGFAVPDEVVEMYSQIPNNGLNFFYLRCDESCFSLHQTQIKSEMILL